MHKLSRAALLTGSALALFCVSAANAKVCRPEDFGAVHDGKQDDTAAIQKAVEACSAGDEVVLGAGTYLSGPLTLSSGDTFVVTKGATLLGTADHEAYRDSKGRTVLPLLGARDAKDITLTGEGTIDGQGASWWSEFRAARARGEEGQPRPKMIVFTGINNLKVTKLTLQNAPMFHLVPQASSNVVVDGLTIRAPADSPNTDGIDPSGRDMVFTNLTIDVGDDNIAIKSGRDDPAHPGAATSNLVVRDCTFLHGHGLSIGSETNGGVTNILAENIIFNGTKTAIRVKTNRDRGGPVHGLVYRNIKMDNVGQAILITAYYPKIPDADPARPIGPTTPDIHDITIEHVSANNAVAAGGLYGLPERPLHGIRLVDVTIKAKKGLSVRHATATLKGSIEVEKTPGIVLQTGGTVSQDR
jgi:polygalacturonase